MGSLFSGTGADSYAGGGTDWAGALGGLGSAVAGIYQTKAQTKQLRQFNRLLGSTAGLRSGFAPAAAGVPAAAGATGGGIVDWVLGGLGAAAGALGLGPDILPGGLEEGGTGIFGPDLFRPTAASARQRMIDAVHPGTGERVYWRPVGRPIMFAGDRSLLLRTRKTIRKMSSSAGCGAARSTFRRRRR